MSARRASCSATWAASSVSIAASNSIEVVLLRNASKAEWYAVAAALDAASTPAAFSAACG